MRRRPRSLGARIIEALSAPFRVDGHELRVRASIGIATGRSEPESLLRDADTAMYRAKATKRGGLCVFEPGMQADTVRELELRNELLRAVACKEITVVLPADRLAGRRRGSRRSRRSPAGTTRRAARFRPTSSSRSPRAPA